MTQDEIQARVAATAAQADGRPVVCLECGADKGGNRWACDACVDGGGAWHDLAAAWDARKATPAPAPRPAPGVGQVWLWHGGTFSPPRQVTLKQPKVMGSLGSGWNVTDGAWFRDADFADPSRLTYVRGPAPVDAVPVGSRWRRTYKDGTCGEFEVLEVGCGPTREFCDIEWTDDGYTGWMAAEEILRDWHRIDTPESSQSRQGSAAPKGRPTPQATAVPEPTPRSPSEITPVPCKHGCGDTVSYPTRHLLRNGRDWSCVELPVSAAVVAEMRAYRERRGGGR